MVIPCGSLATPTAPSPVKPYAGVLPWTIVMYYSMDVLYNVSVVINTYIVCRREWNEQGAKFSAVLEGDRKTDRLLYVFY